MPSPQHDKATDLIRERPGLAVRLYSDVGGVKLPEGLALRGEEGELSDRVSSTYYADTIVTDGPRHDPWYQAIVEIETTLTTRKMLQIVNYAMAAALQTDGKPVHAMVITPDPKASQYDRPYTVHRGSLEITLTVVIVGPGQIPIFTTAQDFTDDPEMGRLVIMAHADVPGVKEAWVRGIPAGGDATSYIEDGLYPSSSKNRRYLEAMVATMARPSMTRIGRENYATGRSEGQAEGEMKAVLAVLRARGLSVSEAQRHIIEETTDIDLLLAWVERAVTVTSTDALLNGA